MRQVWNTTGKGKSMLSLKYVLARYRRSGHKPHKGNCLCCWYCDSCGDTLIDDLRTEANFECFCQKKKFLGNY